MQLFYSFNLYNCTCFLHFIKIYLTMLFEAALNALEHIAPINKDVLLLRSPGCSVTRSGLTHDMSDTT